MQRIACLFAVLAAGMAPVETQTEGVAVPIVVVKEHGVGMPTLVQPYLDKFVAIAAKQNAWRSASGRYYKSRSAAEAFIDSQKPHYGILSLPAFLAFKEKYRLDVIGQVAVSLAGGQRYHMVSKTARDLEGCKGKRLASDHLDDARFIERTVAAGQFKLSEFTLVQTQRPLQTLKQVIEGEAECALIDEAQLAELSHIDGADPVHPVWNSAELPPMAVVAFPAAPAAERRSFQERLDDLCDDEGKRACGEVGIVSLKATDGRDYTAVIAAYGR